MTYLSIRDWLGNLCGSECFTEELVQQYFEVVKGAVVKEFEGFRDDSRLYLEQLPYTDIFTLYGNIEQRVPRKRTLTPETR